MLLEVEEIFGSRNELGTVQAGTAFASHVRGAGEQARSVGRCGDSQPRVARGDVGAGGGASVCSFSKFMRYISSAARGFLKPFKLHAGPDSWARVNIVM